MKFNKYQALGNDFVIVKDLEVSPELARKICDRNFGIGADGVMVHYKTESADAGMKIINSDGSVAVMCGNGLRCFCTYLVKDCGFSKNPINVETGRGILKVSYSEEKDSLSVDADLGKPELINGGFFDLEVAGIKCRAIAISMGNPHLVIFPQTEVDEDQVKSIADTAQTDNKFNMEFNVEVVTDIDKEKKMISMIVKERGAGYTLGCGTGGAAIVEALRIDGIIEYGKWSMTFPGGIANYRFDNGRIIMNGVPQKVFSGIMEQ